LIGAMCLGKYFGFAGMRGMHYGFLAFWESGMVVVSLARNIRCREAMSLLNARNSWQVLHGTQVFALVLIQFLPLVTVRGSLASARVAF
jgi:hypothetical protein